MITAVCGRLAHYSGRCSDLRRENDQQWVSRVMYKHVRLTCSRMLITAVTALLQARDFEELSYGCSV